MIALIAALSFALGVLLTVLAGERDKRRAFGSITLTRIPIIYDAAAFLDCSPTMREQDARESIRKHLLVEAQDHT